MNLLIKILEEVVLKILKKEIKNLYYVIDIIKVKFVIIVFNSIISKIKKKKLQNLSLGILQKEYMVEQAIKYS